MRLIFVITIVETPELRSLLALKFAKERTTTLHFFQKESKWTRSCSRCGRLSYSASLRFSIISWYCSTLDELWQQNYYERWFKSPPITVAAPSKARTVFARSNTGIVGSNPIRGMDVSVRLFCVYVALRVRSGLATGRLLVQGVLPTVYRLRNWKSDQGSQCCR
jgi:hypothetical protein